MLNERMKSDPIILICSSRVQAEQLMARGGAPLSDKRQVLIETQRALPARSPGAPPILPLCSPAARYPAARGGGGWAAMLGMPGARLRDVCWNARNLCPLSRGLRALVTSESSGLFTVMHSLYVCLRRCLSFMASVLQGVCPT